MERHGFHTWWTRIPLPCGVVAFLPGAPRGHISPSLIRHYIPLSSSGDAMPVTGVTVTLTLNGAGKKQLRLLLFPAFVILP